MKKDDEELKLNKVRTDLSIKRTLLACKRTLLSYISMACVFVSLAFTYLKIAFNNQVDWIVITMFCLGLFFLVFGIVEYYLNKREILNLFKQLKIDHEEDEF